MPSTSRTIPEYHKDGLLYKFTTQVTSTKPYSDLAEPNRQLFKQSTDDDYVVTTASTIFHPQGGGQPSDVGQIQTLDESAVFDVSSVRQDALADGQILHLGRYTPSSTRHFQASEDVEQTIDRDKRILFSRLHTAGHVLGLAARHYLEAHGITDVVDGKASHFPGMANVEFIGQIEGKHKAGIQAKVDEYVAAAMPVEIHEWDEQQLYDARNRVYMPENVTALSEGGVLRVVSIVGAGAYPCGGTHITDTSQCGKVNVYKIARAKGISKVSYSLD